MDRIYLDYNATAPVLPEVSQALAKSFAAGYGNPASQHTAGREAKRLVEDARDEIAEILGADLTGREPDRVVFTSGGTEANNLAILGLTCGDPQAILISPLEHPSVTSVADELERRGWSVLRPRLLETGAVDVDDFARLLKQHQGQVRLASIMLGNNETGMLQPVSACANLAREAGIFMHTDAAQVVGKLPVSFRELGVDALTIAAHKFHGPKGIGALVLRASCEPRPTILGAHQQHGRRPGTESVELILGMQRALQVWKSEERERPLRMQTLRDRFEAALLAGWPELVINGQAGDRLPHVSNIGFPGLDRQALVVALDLAGVACSTGSACASGSSEPSPVLVAMGCPAAVTSSSLRFSLGAPTTAAEVDEAAARILRVCTGLRSDSGRGKSVLRPRFTGSKSI